jgi:hypothetical protein
MISQVQNKILCKLIANEEYMTLYPYHILWIWPLCNKCPPFSITHVENMRSCPNLICRYTIEVCLLEPITLVFYRRAHQISHSYLCWAMVCVNGDPTHMTVRYLVSQISLRSNSLHMATVMHLQLAGPQRFCSVCCLSCNLSNVEG